MLCLTLLHRGPWKFLLPHLWAYEVRNSVLMGVRRGRISVAHAEGFLDSLRDLPVRLAEPPSYEDIFALANEHGLTFYDAAYLELVLRQGLPLASLDNKLLKAAMESGATLFQP